IPAASLADPDLVYLVGYCGGKPVCAATALRAGPTAHVAGVATLEAYRGRGVGAAVTGGGLGEGRKGGCASAAPRGARWGVALYRRLGFLPACRHRTYAVPV